MNNLVTVHQTNTIRHMYRGLLLLLTLNEHWENLRKTGQRMETLILLKVKGVEFQGDVYVALPGHCRTSSSSLPPISVCLSNPPLQSLRSRASELKHEKALLKHKQSTNRQVSALYNRPTSAYRHFLL